MITTLVEKEIQKYICKNLNIPSISKLDKRSSDNYCIHNIEEAMNIILKNKEKKIRCVSDYDSDGINVSLELELLASEIGCLDFKIRFPKRMSEGYGLSNKIIDELISEENISLVILADNGITAIDGVRRLKESGIQVLIIDHHIRNDKGELPCADVIIDPHAIEGQADFIDYCASGLVYKLVQCMKKNNIEISENVYQQILIFAAIGTIGDVVSISEDNRLIVKSGLDLLTNRSVKKSKGVTFFLNKLFLMYRCTEVDVAFRIVPVLNAAGRLLDNGAEIVFQTLSLKSNFLDDNYVKQSVSSLIDENNKRKELVENFMPKVIMTINDVNAYPLVVYYPEIPEGIVGLIAGNLAEMYKTTCFVLTDSESTDILKGSARSYKECAHVKNLLDQVSSLLYKYGGHKGAAGLSLKKENLSLLISQMTKYIGEKPRITITPDIYIDISEVPVAVNLLEKYAPFGEGNPDPLFHITGYRLGTLEYIGKKMTGFKATHCGSNITEHINILSFNNVDDKLNEIILNEQNNSGIIGHLSKNILKNETSYNIIL